MLALLVFGCEEGCGVCVGFAFELIFGLLAFGLLELCAPELNVRICEPRFNFSLLRRLVATDLFNLRALLNISDSRQKKIIVSRVASSVSSKGDKRSRISSLKVFMESKEISQDFM